MLEIEAKMKVEDLARVRERLHECGAEHVGEFFEINTFFDTAQKSLLSADSGLRLRRQRDLARNRERTILTFKGPDRSSELKSREEIECGVAGSREAEELLKCLGFGRMLSFEKKRQSWKLDGCEVELDELPLLGTFVEIEGATEALVMHVRQKLGLGARPMIRSSYAALLDSFLQQNGRNDREITFGTSSPQA